MIKKKQQNSKGINGIYNDGACIKIVSNGNIIQVNKSQIKTIDTVRNDMVRLDIGEGALKNIYIRLSEVAYPTGLSNVIDLRNYIKGLMIQNGFATEAKQDNAIAELKLIKDVLSSIKLVLQTTSNTANNAITKLPLREDDTDPSILYKGFAQPNAATNQSSWAIQKISRIEKQIIYEWADGNELYDNVWVARYDLKYYPLGYIH